MISDHHVREIVAGTVGGWAQVFVGHPFDTVKVRLQTQPQPPMFHGPMDCVRKTVAREGVRGLFKGVYSPLVGIGICNAALFSANENFRRLLQNGNSNEPMTLGEMTLAGALSGVVLAFILCPIELVKIRIQVQYGDGKPGRQMTRPYTGVTECALRTFQTEGLRGLYRGMNMTLLREIPSSAAYFGAYEGIKELLALRHANKLERPRPLDYLIAGGIAGQVAWLVCYPQDIIKSRLQIDPVSSGHGSAHYARLLWREGNRNFRVFFRGFGTAMIRAFPANAATFLVYENVMQWMEKSRQPEIATVYYHPPSSSSSSSPSPGSRRLECPDMAPLSI
ncbi:mitochondrial carrier domain-containing protein [Syncephalis fuscata]|nr:mitochondrial carrier domain-containing protein [Syncephalis fuscata]